MAASVREAADKAAVLLGGKAMLLKPRTIPPLAAEMGAFPVPVRVVLVDVKLGALEAEKLSGDVACLAVTATQPLSSRR